MQTEADEPEPPRPVARPTPARERVLLAAADLFARHGVRAVGVDTITAAAGVAKASFYRHFRSKDELVAAWLRSDPPRWLDVLGAEAARRSTEPGAQLEAFFDVLGEFISEAEFHGCAFLDTAAELHQPTNAVHGAIVDYLAEIEHYLRDLAAAAGLRSPAALAVELRLLVSGALITAVALGDGAPIRGPIRVAAATLLDAAR
jgi:AcrR family transcriptional regulator